MARPISVKVFVDGEETHFLDDIKSIWSRHWKENYTSFGALSFEDPVNVKEQAGFNALPDAIKAAFQIRNPDVFFVAETYQSTILLGGIEITAHSPDGSNVEKRYPFIWSGRRNGFSAFVVSPYMKSRPGGQVNKLPHRHSVRNLDLIDEWSNQASLTAPMQQIIPLKELQEDYQRTVTILGCDLIGCIDLAKYFCDLLAEFVQPKSSGNRIPLFISKLKNLATACKTVTRNTKPTSFIEVGDRWIQIYNTRPDSGHWERGEGQFDSIDGRLMFTLDEMSLKNLNKSIEFWMPQLSKKHPWIVEQINRDHGSKRLRNIVRVLSNFMKIKFADDLTNQDLKLLEENPGLTLERLDWESGIYSISSLLAGESPETIARTGLKSPSTQTLQGILSVLQDETMYLSTHRLYKANWLRQFIDEIKKLPQGATVLVPRIPKSHLKAPVEFGKVLVLFAEDCTKHQLMAIRQLHRHCFE